MCRYGRQGRFCWVSLFVKCIFYEFRFLRGFTGFWGLLNVDHDIDAVMDGVEKLDVGWCGDGNADAGGFFALFGVGGDDLEMLPDVRGEGVGVQDVECRLLVFQNNVHVLSFLPVMPVGLIRQAFAFKAERGVSRDIFRDDCQSARAFLGDGRGRRRVQLQALHLINVEHIKITQFIIRTFRMMPATSK